MLKATLNPDIVPALYCQYVHLIPSCSSGGRWTSWLLEALHCMMYLVVFACCSMSDLIMTVCREAAQIRSMSWVQLCRYGSLSSCTAYRLCVGFGSVL